MDDAYEDAHTDVQETSAVVEVLETVVEVDPYNARVVDAGEREASHAHR